MAVPAHRGPTHAWAPAEVLPEDWLVLMAAQAQEDLLQAVRSAEARGLEPPRLGRDQLELGFMQQPLGRALACLDEGRGLAVLRGLPVERCSLAQAELMLWGIGAQLGVAMPQDRAGRRLGHVADASQSSATPNVPGHRDRVALAFHCDRCDIFAMLCIRPAAEGGDNGLVSGARIREQVAARYPHLRTALDEPFPHDLRRPPAPGTPRWAMLPIFAEHDGVFVSRYIRRFIETSQQYEDAPRLTAPQWELLDVIDALLDDPVNVLTIRLEPGDLLLVENYRVWHNRTAFRDWNDPRRTRLMLRLWLARSGDGSFERFFR